MRGFVKKFIIFLIFLCVSCNNKSVDTVIIISADAEWKAFSKIITPINNEYYKSPYGEWFPNNIAGKKVIFFHGGWGKIDAAGSAQYVINEFNPKLLINLGTAGGFPGKVQKGDIILVNKTITYDIYEKMGDSEEAIDYYSSLLSVPQLNLPSNDIKISSIVSADQDLAPGNINILHNKYGAFAGDWESSAIAHIAKKNNVKCYILRGITDIVYQSGSGVYGNYTEFEKESEMVMGKLFGCLEPVLKNENL
jgi:adenosylhomocysteine nucleosidase